MYSHIQTCYFFLSFRVGKFVLPVGHCNIAAIISRHLRASVYQ